jgi:hypothetical protein
MNIFKTLLDPVDRGYIQLTKAKTGERFPEHVSSHSEMNGLGKIRSDKNSVHERILMIADKKKRFFKRYFL